MTTVETIIAIELSRTDWLLGNITEDTVYKTDPEASWCSINNTGTVNVDIRSKGDDAASIAYKVGNNWTSPDTSGYHWILSSDGTNNDAGPDFAEYALWYHISGDTAGNYTLIATAEDFMRKNGEDKISLTPGQSKQFGLKLLTPAAARFVKDKKMQAHIIISAVKAL